MRKHDGKRAAIAYGLTAAVWLAVMFWFSGQSGIESGELSSGLTMQLFGWMLKYVSFDTLHIIVRKMAHFTLFAIEGWLMGSALLRVLPKKHAVTVTGLSCAVVAALNEMHQLFSEGRSCELRDVMIDTSGALLGLAFAVVLLHAFSKLRKK